ncbi:NAD(P)-dependent oxidoreductase [Beduinella massiliensis]|uniref:NAD(P)-dependent oxidoreductase n=1 Tax=Beduinella massiliensis TaxID=1852363 RepID=UPI000C8412DC
MYKIQTLNAISDVIFGQLGDRYTVSPDMQEPDAILVRSAAMQDTALPDSLLSIARAGAGVNNIPVDKCSQLGICVFNTPGANAGAVCELTLAGLLLSGRDVTGGVEWAKTLKGQGAAVEKQVEKGKGQFVGPEIAGKRLGVVGLGAIGLRVANAAAALGMNVMGFDPAITVEHAWLLSRQIERAGSLDELLAACDYVTLHVPLTDGTRGMIGTDALRKVKKGVRVLNFSRGGLVDSAAMLSALADGTVARYVTDFPSDDLLLVKNVLCIPHLGASTPESEENCAVMAARQTRDYLENGSIQNSVNLPDVALAPVSKPRICLIHQNIPNVLGSITAAVSAQRLNISDLVNRSRASLAYTVVDLDEMPQNPDALQTSLAAIDGMLRVRMLGM